MGPTPEVSEGIRFHEQGRLDEAERVYLAVLASRPDHPDALHLLGVVALERGQTARAAELIGRAIAQKPDVAAYHCNLGETYRRLGRLDEAVASFRRALQLRPENPDAANNLGVTLLDLGRLQAAAEALREAVRLRPGFALAHNNLANVLRQLGDWDGAIAGFREAVRLAPNFDAARSNLGQALMEQGKLDEALVHCQEAVRLNPRSAEAHNNLGNALHQVRRLDEAKASYRRALELNVGLAMAHNNMGLALREEGRLDEAAACCRKALAINPDSARYHANLASLLLEQEQVQQAMAEYRRAIELDPTHAAGHEGLGRALHELGLWQSAETEFAAAIQCPGRGGLARSALGRLHAELGRFEQSDRCFRDALRDDPKETTAYYGLATHLGKDLPEDDLAAIRQLLHDKYLSQERLASLHSALAHVLDARSQFAEAAEHASQANALQLAIWRQQGKGYDPAEHTAQVDRLIDLFTAPRLASMKDRGIDSDLPVFVVGLPRSGTTLVEQILASHPHVFGAGELTLVRRGLDALPALIGRPNDDPLTCAFQADRQFVRRLAEDHLAQLPSHSPSALRITDKMPDNYLWIGWIRILFPRARTIHVMRDVRDVAVSCWLTSFRGIRWACDEQHIAGRIADYLRLMDHWRGVCPGEFLDVSYESLVAGAEAVSRRMVEWIGLDWDPACLNFHQNRRPIKTASASQVRQPIYARSVARWKNYAAALAPLLNMLATSH